MSKRIWFGLYFGLASTIILTIIPRLLDNKLFVFKPALLVGLVGFGTGVLISYLCSRRPPKVISFNLLAIFFTRVFFICFILLIFIIVSLKINRAWSAEKLVQIQEDYIAIMEQAENWPVIDERKDKNYGIVRRFHEDLNKHRIMMSIWFPDNGNGYKLELFAKILFKINKPEESNKFLVSRNAMLKTENGKWITGDYIRSEAKYNGKELIAFRLFSNKDENNPIIIRVFLLKDLVPLKK